MNVLVIGGKRFVGYHIANALIKQHHNVVFFNRGKTNAERFPQCENIIGDRNTDLKQLEGRNFDWVIDTCAYFPKQVEQVLDVLDGHFQKYLLISTIAVEDPTLPGFDETVPVLAPDYESVTVTMDSYGPLKSACEEVVSNRLQDKGIIIRPGYIVGDNDYTHRFSYYPIMMHFMEELILPDTGDLPYQFVDGKDLGTFTVHALESNLHGIYHTVGPDNVTFREFLLQCRDIINPSCKLHFVDSKWLEDHNIVIPSAYPTCNMTERGHLMFSLDTSKAKNAGFTTRPIKDSVQDALAYFLQTKQHLDRLEVGMQKEQMEQLLKHIK